MSEALTSIACSGHVLLDLPVFMGPVVILVGWLLFITHRERRREAAETTASPGPEPQHLGAGVA